MKNALVILGGGKGSRFNSKIPKQFHKIGQENMINIILSKIDSKLFNWIILSIDINYRKLIEESDAYKIIKNKIIFSEPGKTRQISSFNALKKMRNKKIKNVLIHDGARPFCSINLFKKIIKENNKGKNVVPYIEHNDRQILKNLKKDAKVINIQTPQAFDYKLILNAHNKLSKLNFSDDSGLLQKLNYKIYYIKGEKTNIKITYPEDNVFYNFLKKPIVKSGIGYDIHKLDKKTKVGLKLCGVKIPYSKLIGHSDADVGLHAICDAIFGALSMRDIGFHFPNNKKKWKNANSSKFIIFCRDKLKEEKFYIINLDVNIIAENPKISKYVSQMKNLIAKLLKIDAKIISIKATTNEKIGFIGNGDGIAAESIVQISDEKNY
tara:strand:+ start:776 stop:1915 length:1140 start_codon:yes stop_codon:yes gene_type:complete